MGKSGTRQPNQAIAANSQKCLLALSYSGVTRKAAF